MSNAVPLFDVTCWLSARQDLYHASLALTGLAALDRSGFARVRFLRETTPSWRTRDGLLLALQVARHGSSASVDACVDLRDRADQFFDEALAACGTYFKRDYSAPSVAALPTQLARKVVAFGLNFTCRGYGSTARVLPVAAIDALGHRRARQWFRHYLDYLRIPRLSAFEQPPDVAVEPTILFQTRLWEPEECYPDDAASLNSERVAVVRALRQAFGEQFVGGLLPGRRAVRDYPDALTSRPGRQSRYIADSRRAAIGVYTRGLYHSAAFKLGEYFASSKCIVATRLRVSLPAPIVDGEHALFYSEPEECVERCRELMADAGRRGHLRRKAWEYYRAHVRPGAAMQRCIELAGAGSDAIGAVGRAS